MLRVMDETRADQGLLDAVLLVAIVALVEALSTTLNVSSPSLR